MVTGNAKAAHNITTLTGTFNTVSSFFSDYNFSFIAFSN